MKDGRMFEGMWENGQLNGLGVRVDEDGNRYTGEFSEGLYNGKVFT